MLLLYVSVMVCVFALCNRFIWRCLAEMIDASCCGGEWLTAAASLVLNNGLYVIDGMPASCEEDGLSSGFNIFSFPFQAEITSKYFSCWYAS